MTVMFWIGCGIAATILWEIWSIMPGNTKPPQATKPTDIVAPLLLFILFGPCALGFVLLALVVALVGTGLARAGKLMDDSYARWRANPPANGNA